MHNAERSFESEVVHLDSFRGAALVRNPSFLTMWGIINGFCLVLSIEQSKREVATHPKRILTGGEGFPLEKEHKFVALCVYQLMGSRG
jgi:hypothetical protein